MTDWSLQFANNNNNNKLQFERLQCSRDTESRECDNTIATHATHIILYSCLRQRRRKEENWQSSRLLCSESLCLAALADDLTPTTRSNFIIPLSNPQAY